MKLIRLAKFYFDKRPHESWLYSKKINLGSVSVITHDAKHDPPKFGITAWAEISLKAPITISDGIAEPPREEREKCEEALNFVANIISCHSYSGREIGAVLPPIALVAESAFDEEVLSKVTGVGNHIKLLRFQPYVPPYLEYFEDLQDRSEGVSLFAEALSNSNDLGKYRDLIRFFENAFNKTCHGLSKKLKQFLRSEMGYTKSEIDFWFSLRNGASHGDIGKAEKRVLESDVDKIVHRMEQAALDVLFNKNTWYTFNKNRREVWVPDLITNSPYPTQFHVIRPNQTQKDNITIEFTDSYGIYRLKSDVPHLTEASRPSNWWPLIPYSEDCPPELKVDINKAT